MTETVDTTIVYYIILIISTVIMTGNIPLQVIPIRKSIIIVNMFHSSHFFINEINPFQTNWLC